MKKITRRTFAKRTGGATLGSAIGLGILPSITRKLHATDNSGDTPPPTPALVVKQLNFPQTLGGLNNTTDLEVTYGEQVIGGTHNTAYIISNAGPDLEARLTNLSAYDWVHWTLTITTERVERGVLDNKRFPLTGTTDLPGDQRYLPVVGYRGGNAHLTYRINDKPEASFDFVIRGKNPLDATVTGFVQGHGQAGAFPYGLAIVQHESRQGSRVFNQFNTLGSAELPNYGAPDGWGIAQLDNPLGVRATTVEVYDWHSNINKFYAELADKQAATTRFFEAVVRTYPNNPTAATPPAAFTVPGTATAYTAQQLSTMVLYNGAAGCQSSMLKISQNNNANFTNPWKYTPGGTPEWTFQDNTNGYAQSVIANEVDGGFATEE